MRGVRSLIVLILIAIPVGWFTYRESTREPGADEPKKEKVFAVESDKIDELTVRSESGEQTRLQKAGDKGWQIVAPATAEPDPAEVAGLTSNLASLELQRVVDENPPDLKEYELAPARIEVTFKAAGQQQTLLIGAKTPPGTDLYAKRAAENRVFLIPSHVESTFNKGTFDLRDKTVLKVDREKLDAIEIAAGGQTVRFTKPAGGEWQMAAPVTARADFSAVEGLVSRFSGMQMKAIATPDESAKAGLEKPVATVRLGTGSSQATLLIGAPAAEGTVYAKDASRPAVFTIESSVLDEVKKSPAEFRQKDLFDARAFNATRLELVRGGQTHAFEKTKSKNKEGQDEEKWRQISPQARELDQPSFDALMNAVTGARATAFVESPAAAKALAAPELTAAVTFDEGKKQERVAFAKSGSDAFASRAGEPGAAAVEASTLDAITKALQELK
jgi:hypothetical protein